MLNRRWLAILLAILMLTSLLPVTALAENGAEDAASVYVTGEDTQPDDTENEDEQQPQEVLPADEQPQEVLPALFAAEDDSAVAAQAVATYATTISGERTITNQNEFPLILQDGAKVTLQGDFEVDYSGNRGQSPVTVEDKANVTLVISGHVTLKGGNAKGTAGAAAAINVPESATLTILSDHEDRSTADGKPADTLTVVGGNAAEGTGGGDGKATHEVKPSSVTTKLEVGTGGDGGGGAAAAIGGNGGVGGAGSSYQNPTFSNSQKTPSGLLVSIAPLNIQSLDTTIDPGGSGGLGQQAGTIRVVGFLNLYGSGGAAASGGAGGNGGDSIWTDRIRTPLGVTKSQIAVISGPGGGGGGGGGLAAPFIGSGGAGGSGGGSGGVMHIGIYSEEDTISDGTTWSGGGGGGGGWPNGGGGGGGIGASYSDNLIHVNKCTYENSAWVSTTDNDSPYITTDYTVNGHKIRVHEICYLGRDGANGGKGGGAGLTGSGGNSPSLNGKPDKTGQTGGLYYALGKIGYHCGTGGAGGKGRSSSNTAAGGKESMGLSPNGIMAASGGGAVAFSPWDEDNSLILATSVKMLSSTYIDSSYTNTGGCRLTDDSATCFGAGDGYVAGGVVAAKFPHMLYDLRDCAVDFSSISYKCRESGGKCSGNDAHYYHGDEHYPYMLNLKVKYNSTSDSGNYLATCFYYDSSSDNFNGSHEVVAYRGDRNLIDCPGTAVVIGSNSGYKPEMFEPPFDYSAILAQLSSTNGFAMPGSSTAKHLFVGTAETTINIKKSTLKQVDMIGGTTEGGNDLNGNKSVHIKDKLYFDAGLYDGSELKPTLNYTYGSKGPLTVEITDIAPKDNIYQWTVKKGDTVVATSNKKNPTYAPSAPGTYTVTLSLKDMLNFEDIEATLAGGTSNTISFTVKQQVTPKVDPNSDIHTGVELTASVSDINPSIPADVVTGYKWTYEDGTTLAENSATYTVKAQDVAKGTIVVTPIIATNYQTLYVAGKTEIKDMLDHSYTHGFCTINKCGEYEPATTDNDDVYQIANAGNLYWFAAKVNGITEHAQGVTAQANAKAKLTADINLESEHNPNANNEWTPIGSNATLGSNNLLTSGGFTGEFDGNGKTISNLSITIPKSCMGFFACIGASANIHDFTVTGKIAPTDKNNLGGDTGIGGVVGHASGGTVSGVVSDVAITGNNLYHVGGIIGTSRSGDFVLEKSINQGNITLTHSGDSIGGLAGYFSGNMTHCANVGAVDVNRGDATSTFLVGGAVGQSGSAAITSCFTYGSLKGTRDGYTKDDPKNYNRAFGMFMGQAGEDTTFQSCTAQNDRVTLNGTTSSDVVNDIGLCLGSNQETNTRPSAEFQSGAACYLLNGNTSANAVWRQNIDNGNGPENYPHLTIAANDIVYYHRDGTYSNSQEVVSVTIAWGSMDFTYTPGKWNTDTLEDNHTWTTANDDDKKVTVTNTGNTAVNAEFTFKTADKFDEYGLTGTLTTTGTSPLAAKSSIEATLGITSRAIPESAFGASKKAQIGTVTVKLTVGS